MIDFVLSDHDVEVASYHQAEDSSCLVVLHDLWVFSDLKRTAGHVFNPSPALRFGPRP